MISVDPGPVESAVLQWDGQSVTNPRILRNEQLRDWFEFTAPCELLVVEMIACYGMPVGAETFDTCVFIGQIKEVWLHKERPFRLVYRREVKQHLCGSMHAKDSNVRQALIDKLGKPGTRKEPGRTYGVSKHLWAALAVAVYVHDTSKT